MSDVVRTSSNRFYLKNDAPWCRNMGWNVNAFRPCDKSPSVSTTSSNGERTATEEDEESRGRGILAACNSVENVKRRDAARHGGRSKVKGPWRARPAEESIDFHRLRKPSIHGSWTVLALACFIFQDQGCNQILRFNTLRPNYKRKGINAECSVSRFLTMVQVEISKLRISET